MLKFTKHFFLLLGCLIPAPLFSTSISADVTVGSKKFTENVILGEIVVQILAGEDLYIDHRSELGGSRILFEALKRGDITVYPEYSGTLIFELLGLKSIPSEPELDRILDELGLARTRPLGFNNTYALGMQKKVAEARNIRRISDLRKHSDLIFGLGHEFLERKDGWPGLSRRYGLEPQQLLGLDHDLGYQGLIQGKTQVIDIYSTDAEIAMYDLSVIEDDLAYFPKYEAMYLYRRDASPRAIQLIRSLSGKISASDMISMNQAAKVDGEFAALIANKFVSSKFENKKVLPVTKKSLSDEIVLRGLEHLYLVGVSLLAAVCISLPLGYIAARRAAIGSVILAGTGILQTIPSLALLVLMIPFFGIGVFPAIAALFVYSLLPILRGTCFGFQTALKGSLDTITILNLRPFFAFRRVLLPLALPSILNGIKIAIVLNIGTATLGAIIGAGGYGQLIIKGIRLDSLEFILAGAIPAAFLAVVAQVLCSLLEKKLVSPGLSI